MRTRTPVEQDYICVILGLRDFHRCGHPLLPRGVGMAESCSEESVPEGDAGELQELGIAG
jgi:hypothetical protein